VEDDNLCIVMPVYNEQANIERVLKSWYPIIANFPQGELVAVNDGSKDDTPKILRDFSQDHPQLHIYNKPNGGHGAAIYDGYEYALKRFGTADNQFVFQTDSDGQTRPEEFDQLWNLRREYDGVFGWRNRRQDGASRIMVTKVLKYTLKATCHVTITDANVPYRLMRNSVLAAVLPLIPEHFNLCNVAISVALVKKGFTIKFLPITFLPRGGGTNSINLGDIFHIGVQALRDFKALNASLEKS
jgi:dolichol-phosphate mannosyltransferase